MRALILQALILAFAVAPTFVSAHSATVEHRAWGSSKTVAVYPGAAGKLTAVRTSGHCDPLIEVLDTGVSRFSGPVQAGRRPLGLPQLSARSESHFSPVSSRPPPSQI